MTALNNNGISYRVAFHTLGCKVNQYETEALKRQFAQEGFLVVDERDKADIYVINTCSVTNLADRKSRQYIRRMKKQYPSSIVAVTGCYAQVSPEEVEAIEGVDIVAGTNEKHNLINSVKEIFYEKRDKDETPKKSVIVHKREELIDFIDFGNVESMENKTRAYVKVQEGCDRFCSYCIIPLARGPIRSRSLEAIVDEAKLLIEKGYKEIVLTGINTALCDCLIEALEIIDATGGDFRIRLSSLEPNVVDKEFVKKLFSFKKLCHHLHLSVQAGSNKVLKNMNRTYTKEKYMDIVNTIKSFDPLYGITTDIIVGFPGETEEDFSKSIGLIEEVNFAKVHGFKYSKRKGTKAATMKKQVPGTVKNARINRLLDYSQNAFDRFLQDNLRSENRVLFEEIDKKICHDHVADFTKCEDFYIIKGYTDNYIRAYAFAKEPAEVLDNNIKDVRLLEPYSDGVLVEII